MNRANAGALLLSEFVSDFRFKSYIVTGPNEANNDKITFRFEH